MQTLWLARHGHRQDFAAPDWAEHADRPHDPGLSPDGHEQARQLGRRVADLGVDRLVTPPFMRAVETAHHVADATGHAVHLEPGLSEWMNADWFDTRPEPLSPAVLADRFDAVRLDDADPCRTPSFPETKHEALARLGGAGQCLAERHRGETLLLVGHGITVQGVLHGLVGADVPDPGCPLASLTQVRRSGDGWRIRLRNDTSHLENGARAAGRFA